MQLKLGEKIRTLRRLDGRTQEDLANALGVTCQAVSRWEANGGYPDMEIMPSIANYFGVSIDELFGYHGEREKKIDELAEKIREMNLQNNGKDVCLDECIKLAREGLVEFPGNEKIMLSLASVLYNAGYVRYGEYHLTDQDGYNIFDVERHRGYTEWQEAIKLYEKLLTVLTEGEMRQQTVRELVQLYVNIGEYDKAEKLSSTSPRINDCRELLLLRSCDGKRAAERCGEALLRMTDICSDLMTSVVMYNQNHLSPIERVRIIKNAIEVYDLVCTDEDYGERHGIIACKYMYLSEHLWSADDRDGAFEALESALYHAKAYEEMTDSNDCVRLLPEDWPWWFDFAYSRVKPEITADPRWDAWVKRCTE